MCTCFRGPLIEKCLSECLLEGLGVAAHSATERKLFARRRMHNVQWTVFANHLLRLRSGWASRQIRLGDGGQPLEVVVARVTKVRCAETEEDGHRTTIPALVLEEIGAVFGARLGARNVRTGAANQLLWVEFVAGLRVASGLAAVVSFVAFEAHVVSVSFHGVRGEILFVGRLNVTLVLETVLQTYVISYW